MITIKNLTKIYPGSKIPAVNDISLHIAKGDVFGFLGPNGAGKTTTVKILVGLMKPTKGSLMLLHSSPQDFEAKKKIGFLPEHPYFYQYLTGREFLQMCTEIFGMSAEKGRVCIEKNLHMVSLSPDAWDRKIGGYSKGMQQRLGVAQALVNDPELVILDEPMSGLDPIGRKQMKDLILTLKKEGKTVFFCSHILSDVEDLCNRIAIIHNGHIVLSGNVDEVTKNYSIPLENIFVDTLSALKT